MTSNNQYWNYEYRFFFHKIWCVLWFTQNQNQNMYTKTILTIYFHQQNKYTANVYRALWGVCRFSIYIAGKTYRHPVNPCKHLQCSSRVHTWFLINLMFYSISQVIGLALTQSYSCQGSFSIIELCLVQSRICSNV